MKLCLFGVLDLVELTLIRIARCRSVTHATTAILRILDLVAFTTGRYRKSAARSKLPASLDRHPLMTRMLLLANNQVFGNVTPCCP